ncbi:TioE family transcriptional regulator [Micromonospora zhanjiangensis]|uniref:TioE family transcriptional regulator n=1 Tax=Micromonospora zhanjiangensis TaxID=1522057 RepID=A0ABV8KRI5_9ACTN
MRPADLARGHGLSTQAVRNYERDGFLPPAARTASGYRVYTERHAAALRAFLSLVPAHGHRAAGQIMQALHAGRLDEALLIIDRSHEQLLRDRNTLDAVREAVDHLTAAPDTTTAGSSTRPGTGDRAADRWSGPRRRADPGVRTVGELAHRLGVTPATLRNWEDAGILAPVRDPGTGYRVFGADDLRDAELAHLLRRGGYPLDRISAVVRQVRTAGGTDALARALDDWKQRLTVRGRAMLTAAAQLSAYLSLVDPPAAPDR